MNEKAIGGESIKTASARLFDQEKMYTYIKEYATMNGMSQTLKALPFAKEKHEGQFRKGREKTPYLYHPLLVSCHAIALGLENDDLVAAALLHDVCEDCEVLPEELPVHEEIRQAVLCLTKENSTYGNSQEGIAHYYDAISKNKLAIMIKLLDRCSNISEMTYGFSKEKIEKYIIATQKWIYPLFESAKELCPEYIKQIFLIQYHMSSVIEATKHLFHEV